MSWNRPFVAAALALALAASPAAAQSGSWVLGVDAGLGIPASGDFKDFWKSGFLLGASAGYRFTPALELGANVSFLTLDPSDDYQELLDAIDADDEFSFTNYGAYGKYVFSTTGTTEPYLLVGLGASSLKEEYEEPGFSEEFTQTALHARGGLGIDLYPSANFGIGARAEYYHVMADEDEIGHDNAGFFAVTAGVRFKVTPSVP